MMFAWNSPPVPQQSNLNKALRQLIFEDVRLESMIFRDHVILLVEGIHAGVMTVVIGTWMWWELAE
jgi:hypothetical protein